MASSFKDTANSQGHEGYRNREDTFEHTVSEDSASILVKGYLQLLKILKFTLGQQNKCIDLGCGAGFITKELKDQGFNIKCLEYSDDSIQLLQDCHGESLDVIQGDMTKFKEDEEYDFIFSREVYLITRVNSFDEQKQTISNIVDSLKKNGIFMLVGSDVYYPNCMDYDLVMESITGEKGIETYKYYEMIFTKFNKFITGYFTYKVLEFLLSPLIYYKKKRGWASQFILVFYKK